MRSLQAFLNTRHPLGSAHALESPLDLKKRLRPLLQQERLLLKQITPVENWGPAQQSLAFQYLGYDLGINLNASASSTPQVASFFPIRGELNLSEWAQTHWMFPFSAPGKTLRWFFWRPHAEGLRLNSWGIPEPDIAETFEYNPLLLGPLLMFVPCLAVSALGVRLGYGGGFYDRFLAQFQSHIVTVACVPEQMLFDSLPTEDHDMSVDIIATPEQIVCLQPLPQLLCKLRT